MKYVKLIAKPDTWFKEGTEVYDYETGDRRLTLEEWKSQKDSGVLVRGTRISDPKFANEIKFFDEGERQDGELCMAEEFDVEIVDEPK